MSIDWFVVANQAKARVFKRVAYTKPLDPLKTIENELGRERTRAFKTDKPGMGIYSRNSLRYSMSGKNNPHEQVALEFAKKLAKFLKTERQKKRFEKLIIVAEPGFAGKLKLAMDKRDLEDTRFIRKDLVKLSDQKISLTLNPRGDFRKPQA